MKWVRLLLLLALLPALGAAQEVPMGELFLGYSHARIKAPGPGNDTLGLNGWNVSLASNLNRYIGLVVDASGHYAAPRFANVNVRTYDHEFLFGPRFTYRTSKVSVFAHALPGLAMEKGTTLGFNEPNRSFAFAIGGGADVAIKKRVAIRVIQVDYLMTNFADQRQSNYRVGAGIVFYFGQR
jgi:hypothetical protein